MLEAMCQCIQPEVTAHGCMKGMSAGEEMVHCNDDAEDAFDTCSPLSPVDGWRKPLVPAFIDKVIVPEVSPYINSPKYLLNM